MQHEVRRRRGLRERGTARPSPPAPAPRTSSAANAAASATPSWPPAPVIRTRAVVSRAERIGVCGAPQVLHARIVPGDALLVGVGWVVLLGHVVGEQEVGERLEAVRVAAGDVERDRILVADVLGERGARRRGRARRCARFPGGTRTGRPGRARGSGGRGSPRVARTRRWSAPSRFGRTLSRRSSQNQPRSSSNREQRDPHDPLDAHLFAPVASIVAGRSRRDAASACRRPPTSRERARRRARRAGRRRG